MHTAPCPIRIRDVGVALQTVVLDGPDPVEPHLLGIDRLLDRIQVGLSFFLRSWICDLRFEDHRELHWDSFHCA
jgi:hypothetical protein